MNTFLRASPWRLAPPVLAVALVALALAAPARAQADRSGGRVSVFSDPVIPIAGRQVTAIAQFEGIVPSSVSLFVRPVGDEDFVEVVGVAQGQGGTEFRGVLPGVVPPQGLEVFAQYVLDGQIFSEPGQNPTEFPYRIPVLSLVATAELDLPARQYRMVTIPFHLGSSFDEGIQLGSDDPEDLFGDDFGEGADPSAWRLLRLPARAGTTPAYLDFAANPDLFGPVRPGLAYWLVTARGGTFDIEGGLSTGAGFDGDQSYPTNVRVTLEPGWNQIGNPFLVPLLWDGVRAPSTVQPPVAFRGSYQVGQELLQPWEGYFVFNGGSRTVLSFEIPTFTESAQGDLSARLLSRAGDGATLLDVRADDGAGRADRVLLGRAGAGGEAPDALRLDKPPAIDDGLRLTASGGASDDLASLFLPAEAPPSWTLALRAGGGRAVEVQVAEHGVRPPGTDLVVDDLDRGVPLAVVAGRVQVPAVAGLDARRLRVRLVPIGSVVAPAALGRPHPNPFAESLAIPLAVPQGADARVEVFDLLGRRVRTLLEGPLGNAGEVRWDGRDDAGRPVAAGAYLVRLQTADSAAHARVTLLR
jgi:hypothetical protein